MKIAIKTSFDIRTSLYAGHNLDITTRTSRGIKEWCQKNIGTSNDKTFSILVTDSPEGLESKDPGTIGILLSEKVETVTKGIKVTNLEDLEKTVLDALSNEGQLAENAL